ncbi:MAG: response regulator transcription factor [Anaerolineae bacterium]|nr:response regulator transcription factor [Anaerolineae bacterium]
MNDPISNINLKVLLLDSDYYALQAINGYLAWDRRTRVTFLTESAEAMWTYLAETPLAELPDIIVFDSDHMGGPEMLEGAIKKMRSTIKDVMIICLAQFADPALIAAADRAGARAYLLKHEVRLQIAWAIVYARDHDFLVTQEIARMVSRRDDMSSRIHAAAVLPKQREYPHLTDRVRQAIELCVVKGMPAHLAADEMGISLHTIRSYIKEGYRILEAYDETEYPTFLSPQERAFMRLTRPEDNEGD